jgi:hypothetical protein
MIPATFRRRALTAALSNEARRHVSSTPAVLLADVSVEHGRGTWKTYGDISTYQPGDKIFVFGFSRGAYTARALTGMLDVFGVFRPTSQNLVPYAISAYTKQQRRQPKHQHDVDDERRDDDSKLYFKLLRTYATQHDVHGTGHTPVHFVGLWDTVKSAGTLTRRLRWPFTRRLPHARTIRHAISIEENRRPFAPYRLRTPDPSHLMVDKDQDLLEVWFAGSHSDVGGMYATGTKLSDIALKWMADEAVHADLIVRPKRYAHMSRLDGVDPAGPPHTNCALWRLLGPGRRTLPTDALIHASVQHRAATDPAFLKRLPPAPTYVCQDWRTPRKPPTIHTEQIRRGALLENAGSAD